MLKLFILPRKGLYQLTICQHCGHIFGCANCDAKLVTYRKSDRSLELFCHQCQTYYNYPTNCPECGQEQIVSKYGAIDELAETLQSQGRTVYRLDKAKTGKHLQSPKKLAVREQAEDFLTTRIFDPSLQYEEFDQIIFVNAENLLASPDYLVQEETLKNLSEVFLRAGRHTEIILDTNQTEAPLIKEICRLDKDHPQRQTVLEWYARFLPKENQLRQTFGFPPHRHILLLTTQEKHRETSFQKLKQIQLELKKYTTLFPEISVSSPYPARFFRRQNLYSQHLLIKYPRQYPKFSQLREIILSLTSAYQVQVRLNPRHLF